MEALRSVELAEFAGRRVEQLSGGQQQRVGIARALMQEPTIMLGDEPVSSLDPVTSRDIMELFVRIHRENQRITIVNLHDVELALRYCDRIIGLRQGRVVFDGPPGDVHADVRRDIYEGSAVGYPNYSVQSYGVLIPVVVDYVNVLTIPPSICSVVPVI